jgi:alkylhydroperoxidase family enzyme
VTDPIDELREIAARAAPPPPAMREYLEKVHVLASTVTDRDVDELEAAGVSEDEIFEQTVAAAIGEGLRRLDRAEEVIG